MKMHRLLSGAFLSAISIGVSGFSAVAAQNLLVNPGFEELGGSYDGWFVEGSGPNITTMGDEDSIVRTGFAAAKIFGEFNGCPGDPTFDVGVVGQTFPVVVGDVYEFSGYSFMSSADPITGTDTCSGNRLLAQIAFFNAGAEVIASNEAILGDYDFPLDQWETFFVSIPAPAGAVEVQALLLFLQPGCDEGAVFVDDLKLRKYTPTPEPNLLANPNFDGNLIGWSTFGNTYYDGNPYAGRSPDGSLKMFSTFVEDSPSGVFQSFPATPGTTFQLDAYALSTCIVPPDVITGSNDNFTTVRIVFRDGGGAEIGAEEALLRDASFDLGGWMKVSVTATAPAGAATVEPFLLFISPTLMGGAFWYDAVRFGPVSPVDTPSSVGSLPFTLGQNVPNPFNPTTRIAFDLSRSEAVELVVYDVAGRRVASLLRGVLEPGAHSVTWDGRADDGTPVASGVYRYELQSDSGRTSRRMTLLK
jgi:hypothetical protein